MLARLERCPLTFAPTPIERLERLSAHLGGKIALWAKREDCKSGLAFGGNKLRKLEYIVPEVIAKGADTLVSIGGVQSNHTRMVAAVAAKLGMKSRLVQESWVPHEDALYDRIGNILLCRILGADVRLVDEGKSMQGMIDLVRQGYFPAGSKVLYAHLGGAPALNGYSYAFRKG